MPPVEPMTVAELVAYLQTLPQDMWVAQASMGTCVLVEKCDLHVGRLPEPDEIGDIPGWRPDMPTRQYLVLPGN